MIRAHFLSCKDVETMLMQQNYAPS
jgi:hypothetical protein